MLPEGLHVGYHIICLQHLPGYKKRSLMVAHYQNINAGGAALLMQPNELLTGVGMLFLK
jgi:hypothetical protein